MSRKLEEYANEVVKQAVPDAAIDPVTIIALATAIIKIVMEVIEKCKENNPQKIASVMKNPGLFNRARFERLVKQQLGPNADLVSAEVLAEACMKVADKKDVAAVEEVVKEVKKTDYWLI